MHAILEWTVPLLPDDKPRHLLGIGEIDDIFACVERGIDMFDCVTPTRWGRNGAVLVSPRTYRDGTGRCGHGRRCAASQHSGRQVTQRTERRSTRCAPATPAAPSPAPTSTTCSWPASCWATGCSPCTTCHFMTTLMRRIRASIIDGTFADLRDAYLDS